MKNQVVVFVALSVFAAVGHCQQPVTIGKVGSKTLIAIVGDNEVSWVAAKSECEKRYMTLASLENGQENSLLQDWLLKRAPTAKVTHGWAGGARQKDGSWIWVANGKPLTYSNWREGEPSTAKYSGCLYISPSSPWTATYCEETLAMPICQSV